MNIFSRLKNWLFGASEVVATDNAASAPQPAQYRPLIGISGGDATSSQSLAAIVSQIRSSGAQPIFLGEHEQRVKEAGGVQRAVDRDLAGLDGLVIMGNNSDIDPKKYGAIADSHTKIETDVARADYEEAAIKKALDSGMPLLGICGGVQRINVLGGGTLHQHVPDIVGDNHHMQADSKIAPFVPVQAVTITPDSLLASIAGNTKSVYTPGHQALPPNVVMENSFHHQAIKDVREDFRVNAVSDDGIIEGIEPKPGSRYANQFVLGVQWHPEFGASDLGPKIAASVTQAAKNYALQKEMQATLEIEDNVPSTMMRDRIALQRQQQKALGWSIAG